MTETQLQNLREARKTLSQISRRKKIDLSKKEEEILEAVRYHSSEILSKSESRKFKT